MPDVRRRAEAGRRDSRSRRPSCIQSGESGRHPAKHLRLFRLRTELKKAAAGLDTPTVAPMVCGPVGHGSYWLVDGMREPF
jgi:hypothetical protein